MVAGILPPRNAGIYTLYAYAGCQTLSIGAGLACNQTAAGLSARGGGGVFIACAVLFCMWIHRAASNALASGRNYGFDFTPGWAVGYFFVPIANLWRPYQIVRAIWDSANAGNSSVVGLWWGVWIAGNVLA